MDYNQANETISSNKKMALTYYHEYGTQIKKCNSENSTPADFVKLSEIKKNWSKVTSEATNLQTKIKKSRYGKQDLHD